MCHQGVSRELCGGALDLIDWSGEEAVYTILSSFQCPQNSSMENFINEHNRFFPFGNRYDIGEATEYIQLFRFL